MNKLSFSLLDYQNGLNAGLYTPPDVLCPYYEVDPVLFRQHGNTDQRRGDLSRVMSELRKRTGRDYFGKTYPLQARTLDYSERSFPAYRFILPEVMTEDWLAIVDWGKFQRDHVLHQPLCGYVVLKLLDGDGASGPLLLPNGSTILDVCVDNILQWRGTAFIRDFLLRCGIKADDPILQPNNLIARNVWRIFFREAVYVAAIFHDLGYPWQYAERLHSNLHGINTPALKQNQSVDQIFQSFGQRLIFSALQGYNTPDMACPSTWHGRITQLIDLSLKLTHGMPGALGFLHLNDCVRRYPSAYESPLHLLCVEWAAIAIMMHDMRKLYWGETDSSIGTPENLFLRLSFDKDPLSAMVTLADVIQEFERPAVDYGNYNNHGHEMVTLDYNRACSSTEFELDPRGMLTLRFVMVTDEMRAIKRNSLLRENHEYFDPQYGYLDMSGLGIRDVRMTAE